MGKVIVTDLDKIQKEIEACENRLRKLRSQLIIGDNFQLSSVYKENSVFGVIYHEHGENFEAYDVMSNQPGHLDGFAREKAVEWKNYLPIYVASFAPRKIIRRYEVK